MNIRPVTRDRASICRTILQDLPEWFGRPDAVERYASAADTLPMMVAFDMDQPIGFVSLQPHFETAVEMPSLGGVRRHHRRGIGRALVGAAESHAGAQDARLLTVKTLGPSHPDPHYAQTRAFYRAMGFLEVEELHTLWNSGDPCLLLAKPIAPVAA